MKRKSRFISNLKVYRDLVARIRRDLPHLDERDTTSLFMDLDSVEDLDIEKLLKADAFTFAHDISGIVRHMDRSSYPGKLKDCFVPRCSRRPKDFKMRKPRHFPYTHIDSEGMLWRFVGARPVSLLADLVMGNLKLERLPTQTGPQKRGKRKAAHS